MTAPELPFDPADVRRVEDPDNPFAMIFLPRMEESWPPLARLAWLARVTEVRNGMPPGTLAVEQVGRERGGLYRLDSPDPWLGAYPTFTEMWEYITIVAKGWRIAQAVDARAAAGG